MQTRKKSIEVTIPEVENPKEEKEYRFDILSPIKSLQMEKSSKLLTILKSKVKYNGNYMPQYDPVNKETIPDVLC